MRPDWPGYFISALLGATIAWTVCSLWAVRMMTAMSARHGRAMEQLRDLMKQDDCP